MLVAKFSSVQSQLIKLLQSSNTDIKSVNLKMRATRIQAACCILRNKTVLSSLLNVSKPVFWPRSTGGREFQADGQETAKALGPSLFVEHGGMMSSPVVADRSLERPETELTGMQYSAR